MSRKDVNELRQQLESIYLPKFKSIENIIKGINNKSFKESNAIFKDLYNLLSQESLLIQALGNIRSNKGTSTPGITSETLNRMSILKINRIAQSIKNRTFKFSPIRRVFIPKPGKSKLRPLGIPTFTDRIVQEAIRIILEAIYEPTFEKLKHQNYGFRPGKSPHDSIRFIKNTATGSKYAIEGDIVGAYDNVNIKKLISILGNKIHDQKFLNFIKQGCYSGLLHMGKYEDTLLGVPQGGIASPILFNIYMHEFDLFVNNELQHYVTNYNKQNNRIYKPTNPEYKRIDGRIYYYNSQIKKIRKPGHFKELSEKQKQKLKHYILLKNSLVKERINIPSIIQSKREIRIVYSRYADDFIIFTNSTSKFTSHLRDLIGDWLKNNLKLDLSPEKTKLTNVTSNKAKFLGFDLYSHSHFKLSIAKATGNLIRTAGNVIKVGIDMDRVLNRLLNNGFCNKKFKPIAKRPYSVLPIREIIAKYNYMISGSANYFIPIIDRVQPFTRIHYILEYSCYGTIATKIKSSIFKIFRNFGKPPIFKLNVSLKLKDQSPKLLIREFSIISYLQAKRQALLIKERQIVTKSDIFSPMKRINWRTYKNLNAFCIICGTRENIEWHHVRSIKKGTVTGFTQVMKQLNRKQVPLCHKHHTEITSGRFSDIKISDLVKIDYYLA